MKKLALVLILSLILCFSAGSALADDAQQEFVPQPTNNIPEPATMLLLGSGIIGLVIMRKKINK